MISNVGTSATRGGSLLPSGRGHVPHGDMRRGGVSSLLRSAHIVRVPVGCRPRNISGEQGRDGAFPNRLGDFAFGKYGVRAPHGALALAQGGDQNSTATGPSVVLPPVGRPWGG